MATFYQKHKQLKTLIKTFLIGGTIGFLVFDVLTGNIPFIQWQRGVYTFLLNGSLTASLSYANGYLTDSIKISWTEQPLKRLLVTLVLTTVITLIIAYVIAAVLVYIVWGITPIETLLNPDAGYYITVLIITFMIATFMHGRAFLFEWRETYLEAERLKQAHLSARFENLKNQINPHFLFNSLNVLSNLVYKDPDLSAKFIQHLADVYRYVLDTRDREVVPLATELEALRAYIFLLQIRFGENMQVEIDLQPDQSKVIPPLTLQMLLENAVKHNIVSRNNPLHVRITQQDEDFIVVTNNLQRKTGEVHSNGIGLANIQERYRYISDQLVRITQNENSFSVTVPLIKMAS